MNKVDSVIKGFNAGYLLEKYLPDLSQLLMNSIKEHENPYLLGFQLGRLQLQKEADLDRSIDLTDGDTGELNLEDDDLTLDV